ncbi:MAG: hypothetical protein ACI9K2_006090, partial [Myxococcota bacterium]
MQSLLTRASFALLALGLSTHSLSAAAADPEPPIQFAGALEFGPEGVLFVGDNVGGAVFAIEVGTGSPPAADKPIDIDDIDVVIGGALGVGPSRITINDMAVHPTTREVYLSVSRGHATGALPALVKVDHSGQVHNLPLAALPVTRQPLHDVPDGTQGFQVRGFFGQPPSPKEVAKAQQPMNLLAIMDLEYYGDELFVSGISNEEFASTLRRLPYPFTGEYGSTHVEIFHVAHDAWETRAPIRAMEAKNLGGTDYLIASYTCTPVVLIPLQDIRDGAAIKGRTIGDVGNGQPIDMFTFHNKLAGGGEYLYLTNLSRQPQIIPLEGLADAEGYTDENTERGMKTEMNGALPVGPVGNPVMFVGTTLQAAVLNDSFFVSVTRDPYTGSLNLESLPAMFPIKVHDLIAEADFPRAGGEPSKRRQKGQ